MRGSPRSPTRSTGRSARAQLRACGLSASGVGRRVARGRCIACTAASTCPATGGCRRSGSIAAAVLACGPRASACAPDGARIHVTCDRDGADARRRGGAARRRAAATGAWSPTRLGDLRPAGRRRRRRDPGDVGRPDAAGLRAASSVGGAPRSSSPRPSGSARSTCVAVHDLLAHVPGHPGAPILRAAVGDAAGARGADRLARRGRAARGVPGAAGLRRAGVQPADRARTTAPSSTPTSCGAMARWSSRPIRAAPTTARASYRSDRTRDRELDAHRAPRRCASATSTCVDPAACAAEVARAGTQARVPSRSGTELVTQPPQAAAATGAPSLYCSPASALATSEAGGSKRSP